LGRGRDTVADPPAEEQRVQPRFVPDDHSSELVAAAEETTLHLEAAAEPAPESGTGTTPDPSWRDEIANRVHSYRAKRRPQKPRFPSLSLKFESPEPFYNPLPSRESVAPDSEVFAPESAVSYPRFSETSRPATGRLIEFPRLASFSASPSELADPVADLPRILEAPELNPPPPALGGILIESSQSPVAEKRPGIEIPLQLASMSRRIAAAAVDATLVLLGFGLFAAIFYRVTGAIPALPLLIESAIPVLVILWFGYQYLSLVHAGTTPGLRLAKLQLNRFDGSVVPMRTRRWRVFTSILSLGSLGLGYAWSLIDEDQLCWHDRVTATHIAPNRTRPVPPS